MKAWHVGVCVGFMALAAVLAIAGVGAFAFLAPLGCAVMMGMMVWMMASPQLRKKVRGLASGKRGSRTHEGPKGGATAT